MKLVNVIKCSSTENVVALETSPQISRDIEHAFISITSSPLRPEWRSPGFKVLISGGLVLVSPPSVVKPEFVKNLIAVLEEAEKAVAYNHGQANAALARQEEQTTSTLEEIAKVLGVPIK